MPTLEVMEQSLRGAALRVTRPRLAVLAAVHAHPHADTDSLIKAARADLGAVSHQAVYDVLHALTAAGLLRRIEPAGSAARYEARVGDNHHHLMCRSCAAVVDVDAADEQAPCLSLCADQHFAVEHTEVTFWGLCPRCSPAPASLRPSPGP